MSHQIHNLLRKFPVSDVLFSAIIVVWACGIMGLTPVVAEEPNPAVREQRRKQIEDLPEAERERIKRNFKDFQQLPDETKTDLRELHEAVEKDAELKDVLKQYAEWLETLTLGQRDDLRKETNPVERAKKVQAIRDEQERRSGPSGGNPGFGLGRGGPGFRPWHLNKEDLRAVLTLWEKTAVPQFSDEQKERLKGLSGWTRDAYLVGETVRPDPRAAGSQPPPRFLNEKLVKELIAQISDREQKAYLDNQPGPDHQRLGLMSMIMRGIIVSSKPDAKTLQDFFVTLDSKERDEIMRAPTDRFDDTLFRHYRDKHPELYPKLSEWLYWQFMPRGGPFRGPGDDRFGPGGPNRGPQGNDPRRGPPQGGSRPEGRPDSQRGEKKQPGPVS